MYKTLLESVICPSCDKHLELIAFENGETTTDGQIIKDVRGTEVISGVLKCNCGLLYPIIEGVPRFLDSGIRRFPAFFNQHSQEIASFCGSQGLEMETKAAPADDDYEDIRKSFSQEWGAGVFDYDNFNTWGWTLEQRKEVVAGELDVKPQEFAGKYLLDAGCGNGTLSAALTDLGPNIVGLDLNDGLGSAYRYRTKYSKKAKRGVQYVQGNVICPPLKEGVFDLVYSSGVIHHTPSSKQAFDALARMPKEGGRLYIWVYGKRGVFVRLFFWWGRGLKNWMSLKSVLRVCRIISPFYKWAADMLRVCGLMKFRPRTVREVTLDLFDAFAPRYNHWHTEAEVRSWFEEHGFRNVTVRHSVRQGFGMYGDKVSDGVISP